MALSIRSIRPFLGSRDFLLSCRFYRELGFEEISLEKGFSLFQRGSFAFYLQDAFVSDWVNNTMVFAEIESPEAYLKELQEKNLERIFPGVRIESMVIRPWGKEFFVHDPSGILWHFGSFFPSGK